MNASKQLSNMGKDIMNNKEWRLDWVNTESFQSCVALLQIKGKEVGFDFWVSEDQDNEMRCEGCEGDSEKFKALSEEEVDEFDLYANRIADAVGDELLRLKNEAIKDGSYFDGSYTEGK